MNKWLKELGKTPQNPNEDDDLNLCNDTNIHFWIISVITDNKYPKNQKSIVMKLYRDYYDQFNNFVEDYSSLLFSGDMEGPTARWLATTEPYSSSLWSTHYKVSHHGASSQANKEEWLRAISPIEAHISSSFGGTHGHPRCEAIQRIMNYSQIGLTYPIPDHPLHNLTCFNSRSDFATVQICHRIYSTSPNGNKACVIKLEIKEKLPIFTYYFCGTADNWKAYFAYFGLKRPREDESPSEYKPPTKKPRTG